MPTLRGAGLADLRQMAQGPEPFRRAQPGVTLNDVDPLPEQYELLHLIRQWLEQQRGERIDPPIESVFPRERERMREEERLRRNWGPESEDVRYG